MSRFIIWFVLFCALHYIILFFSVPVPHHPHGIYSRDSGRPFVRFETLFHPRIYFYWFVIQRRIAPLLWPNGCCYWFLCCWCNRDTVQFLGWGFVCFRSTNGCANGKIVAITILVARSWMLLCINSAGCAFEHGYPMQSLH